MSFQPKWCTYCGANTHNTEECPNKKAKAHETSNDDSRQNQDLQNSKDDNTQRRNSKAKAPIIAGIHTPLPQSSPFDSFDDPPGEGSPTISTVGTVSVVDSDTPLLNKYTARSDDQAITSAAGGGSKQ
ncbi:hypothetical protein PV10_03936 [Exophiala mesophila]|uniref:Uncharacterized protein n=1 Tax=Exophiala mesophila TaxID=212818 RepID=A0A0D2A0R4_EXOME|nr:uncharacterized protein PV10_03936 [Exophiala mesophila]KIV92663.1 hypothetical protein PV10_03936 [Exophiala mesophila]